MKKKVEKKLKSLGKREASLKLELTEFEKKKAEKDEENNLANLDIQTMIITKGSYILNNSTLETAMSESSLVPTTSIAFDPPSSLETISNLDPRNNNMATSTSRHSTTSTPEDHLSPSEDPSLSLETISNMDPSNISMATTTNQPSNISTPEEHLSPSVLK